MREYVCSPMSASNEASLVLALNLKQLFMSDGIGWIITLYGDWESGPCSQQRLLIYNQR